MGKVAGGRRRNLINEVSPALHPAHLKGHAQLISPKKASEDGGHNTTAHISVKKLVKIIFWRPQGEEFSHRFCVWGGGVKVVYLALKKRVKLE